MRWAVGVGAAIMSAIGLVLLFLLTLATNNRVLYERNYAWLFGVNVFVALLLLLVLGWVAVRLGLRLRKGRFGSRLLVKLAAIFALVGLMPGLLIYVVSYQFVTRSIESWFDVKVEGALSAGVNLARVSLDSLATDMAAKTRNASAQVAQVPDAAAGLVLERMRDTKYISTQRMREAQLEQQVFEAQMQQLELAAASNTRQAEASSLQIRLCSGSWNCPEK